MKRERKSAKLQTLLICSHPLNFDHEKYKVLEGKDFSVYGRSRASPDQTEKETDPVVYKLLKEIDHDLAKIGYLSSQNRSMAATWLQRTFDVKLGDTNITFLDPHYPLTNIGNHVYSDSVDTETLTKLARSAWHRKFDFVIGLGCPVYNKRQKCPTQLLNLRTLANIAKLLNPAHGYGYFVNLVSDKTGLPQVTPANEMHICPMTETEFDKQGEDFELSTIPLSKLPIEKFGLHLKGDIIQVVS